MLTYCVYLALHSQVLWPRDKDGDPTCPYDYPILEPTFSDPPPPEPGNPLPELEPQPKASVAADGSPIYWDHGPEVITSFDDFERVAQEYTIYGAAMDARAYTDEENARADALQNDRALKAAQAELNRAMQLNAAPNELRALQEATLAVEGIEPGDPWRQPLGAHDAYPLGALVSHAGKTWRSTIAANVWQPGVSGWVEEGSGVPAWVQPTGSHDAYALGAVVMHVGKYWRSDIGSNVWEPGAVGSENLWTEIPKPEGF